LPRTMNEKVKIAIFLLAIITIWNVDVHSCSNNNRILGENATMIMGNTKVNLEMFNGKQATVDSLLSQSKTGTNTNEPIATEWVPHIVEMTSDTDPIPPNQLHTRNKTWGDLQLGFIASLLASFVAAMISIIVGYSLAKSKEYCFNRKFGRFFGGYWPSKNYTFVLDYYKGSGHPTKNMGSCNAFILSYLSPVFERHTGRHPHVIMDDGSINWQQTLLVIGSPSTNSITKGVLTNNQYVKFIGTTNNAQEIEVLLGNYTGPSLTPANGHYGIVLKLNNPYSSGHFLFVLAGLTNESTSAAGLLLRERWANILSQISDKEFLIVFEVDIPGQDQTYKTVYTSPDISI
jgi:hypothetical protein